MKLEQAVLECYRAYSDSGMSIEDWAAKAGLHPHTIERIAAGETRFPRFQTIMSMAEAVGLNFVLTKLRLRRVG